MKKLLALCMCFCIVIAMAISPANAQGETSKNIDMKEKMTAQKDAVMVNKLLYDTFQLTSTGYAYPSNFAGTYIEDGILHILWTELSEQQQRFYDELFKPYNGSYNYKIVDYSYSDLKTLCEKTCDELKNQIQISSYCVDVRKNSAKIGVIKEDYEKAVQYSQTFNQKSNVPIYYDVQERPKTNSTLMGGTPCTTNGVPFTIGMCGTYNGQNAAVTCGHSMTLNRTIKHYGTTIGTTSYIQTTYGDYSIILTNSNATLTNRVKTGSNTYIEIEGTLDNPPVGAIVCMYGDETGYSVYGEIEDVGLTITYDNGLTVRELNRVNWTECAAVDGDSGGPYFMEDFGCAVFCGVHSGSYPGGTVTLFTPYYFIRAAGFDAKID